MQTHLRSAQRGGWWQLAGDITLLVSLLLWFRVQLALVGPAIPPDGAVLAWAALGFDLLYAGVLALALAVVIPGLVALVLPFNPIGQLLAETKIRTWGALIVLPAALYLLHYAFQVSYAWWAARLPADLVLQQAIVSLILQIVIPSLSFSWSSPAAMLLEVHHGQEAERLRRTFRSAIELIHARHVQVLHQLRHATGAQLADAGQQAAVLIAEMDLASARSLRVLADGFRIYGESALAIDLPTDSQIIERAQRIADAFDESAATIIDLPPSPAAAPAGVPLRAAAARHVPAGAVAVADDAFDQVRRRFGAEPFGRADIEELLGLRSSATSERLTKWHRAGWVRPLDSVRGKYEVEEEYRI